MRQFLFASILLFGLSFFFPANALAYVTCQPIYGGGETCIQVGNLLINKTVQDPQSKAFVDNLGINNPMFAPDQDITFKLIVTNDGNETVKNVVIKDTYPQYVNFTSGDGKFDNNTKTLTIEVAEIKAGESKTYTLAGKIVSSSSIPGDTGTVCVVNQATATSNGKVSQDNAQFCIKKSNVLGVVFPPPSVKTSPPTGANAIALFGLIPVAISGFILRRRTRT